MTDLRDARFRQALDQAPDAGLQPPARVREAIRGAAHGAVQPAWRRWWPAAGAGRTPWLAAFASVLVASLVVVIWQGQEIPGARQEPQFADRPAPAPASAPTPAPAPSAPALQQTPPPAPRVTATRAPAAQPAPEPRARAAADALEARHRESTERRATARDAQQAATGAVAEAPPAEALAKAAPPPSPPPAPVAAAPPPPAAMAAPAPAGVSAAARFAPSPASAWRQVRISSGDRSVLVPRSQAEGLPGLVALILEAPREPAAPTAATLRLDLEAQGVLEWSEEGWRLLSQGDPQRPQLLRASESTAAALRAEAERLLNR